MKIEYRKIFNKNYAVITDYNISDYKECYRSKMLKSNKLDHFLTYDTQNINGSIHFTYDISSKQSIYSFYENSDIDYDTIRHLIMSLKATLDTLTNYLLEPDYIVLDPKMIYMNIATKSLYFCYCPGEKNNFYESLNSLICYILSKINHEDANSIILAYSLQQQSLNTNYTFDDLMEILNKQVFNHKSSHINQTEQNQKNYRTDICSDNVYEDKNKACTTPDNYETETLSDIQKHFSRKNTKWTFIIPALLFFAALGTILYYGLILQSISVELMMILSVVSAFFSFELLISFKNKQTNKPKITSEIFEPESSFCSMETNLSYKNKPYSNSEKNRAGKTEKNYLSKNNSNENNSREGYLSEDYSNKNHSSKGYSSEDYLSENYLSEGYPSENHLREGYSSENYSKENLSNKNCSDENYYEDTIILGYRSSESMPRLVYTGTDFVSENELASFPYTIGKMTDNVNMIIDNPMISRIHAKIYLKEGHYYIEDMNSSNGTYINNTLLQPHSLTEINTGDYITFSHLTYIFQ